MNPLLAMVLAAIKWALLAGVKVQADTPLVFAHYMLNYYIDSNDVAGLSQQISLAQQNGIDAFALNTDAWDSDRQTRADNFFQAADNLNFKLFFSIDLNYQTQLTFSDVTTILNRYSTRSSYLLSSSGKRFLSTFAGRYKSLSPYTNPISTWRDGIFPSVGGRDQFYFVPYFDNIATTQTDLQANVTNILQSWGSLLDGLFAWDTSGWPYFNGDYNNPSNEADTIYATACANAGKTYMPSISPWFFRPDIGVRGNYAGDDLWRTRWEQVIALRPSFVEIISWNDWVERHYVVTVPPNTISLGAAKNHATGFPHLPYLDLASRYYIPWFKNGQESSIKQDVLYLYYYTQTKNASTLPLVNVLQDRLYATVLLTQSGDVTLTSGTETTTASALAAGIHSVSMPFNLGQQSAKLSRGGTTVISVTGDMDIVAPTSPPEYNVYAISGVAQ